jgi:hypothetical protein
MILEEIHDQLGGPTRIDVAAIVNPGYDRSSRVGSVDRAAVPTCGGRGAAVHLNGKFDCGLMVRKAHLTLALPGDVKEGLWSCGPNRGTEAGCHRGVGRKHVEPL